jgi:hypothetical protein
VLCLLLRFPTAGILSIVLLLGLVATWVLVGYNFVVDMWLLVISCTDGLSVGDV